MLKAYFLKEDPLWFAFWGLLTVAWKVSLRGRRHVEGRCGDNQAGADARRQVDDRWGESMGRVKKTSDTLSRSHFPSLCAAARVVGATYDTAPNYRVLLLLWYAVT